MPDAERPLGIACSRSRRIDSPSSQTSSRSMLLWACVERECHFFHATTLLECRRQRCKPRSHPSGGYHGHDCDSRSGDCVGAAERQSKCHPTHDTVNHATHVGHQRRRVRAGGVRCHCRRRRAAARAGHAFGPDKLDGGRRLRAGAAFRIRRGIPRSCPAAAGSPCLDPLVERLAAALRRLARRRGRGRC